MEDRLLVALAGRGSLRIGQFINRVYNLDPEETSADLEDWLGSLSDEALVEAVEGQVRVDRGVGRGRRATSRTEARGVTNFHSALYAAVFCPTCWSVVSYMGAGAFGCRAHGEVTPIGLGEILPTIHRLLGADSARSEAVE